MNIELSDVIAPGLGAVLGGNVAKQLMKNQPRARLLGTLGGATLGGLQNSILGKNRGVAPAVLGGLGATGTLALLQKRMPHVHPIALLGAGLLGGTALGAGLNSATSGHGGGTVLGGLGGGALGAYAGYNPMYSALGGAALGNIASHMFATKNPSQ